MAKFHHAIKFKDLRQSSAWKLLSGDHAPLVLGNLGEHFGERERRLPASVFHQRVAKDIEMLRLLSIRERSYF